MPLTQGFRNRPHLLVHRLTPGHVPHYWAPPFAFAGRSHGNLGEVFHPVVTRRLAAGGRPLWGCGAGLLFPVIDAGHVKSLPLIVICAFEPVNSTAAVCRSPAAAMQRKDRAPSAARISRSGHFRPAQPPRVSGAGHLAASRTVISSSGAPPLPLTAPRAVNPARPHRPKERSPQRALQAAKYYIYQLKGVDCHYSPRRLKKHWRCITIP